MCPPLIYSPTHQSVSSCLCAHLGYTVLQCNLVGEQQRCPPLLFFLLFIVRNSIRIVINRLRISPHHVPLQFARTKLGILTFFLTKQLNVLKLKTIFKRGLYGTACKYSIVLIVNTARFLSKKVCKVMDFGKFLLHIERTTFIFCQEDMKRPKRTARNPIF